MYKISMRQLIAGQTVWRVQNAQGLGPFAGTNKQIVDQSQDMPDDWHNLIDKIDQHGRDTSTYDDWMNINQPYPSADFSRGDIGKMLNAPPNDVDEDQWFDWEERINQWLLKNGWKFGFQSKESAIAWFGPDNIKALERYGYNLVELPVAEMHMSDSGRQVIFR